MRGVGVATSAGRSSGAWWGLLIVLLASLQWPSAALASETLAGWRDSVREARILAENDAPGAFRQAHHLQDIMPPQATPADQASVLNLLARAELYLIRTEDADRHAKEALALAQKAGDRIGQIEAYLTISTNAVHLGDISLLISAATNSLTLLDGIADRPDLLGESLLRTAVMYRRIGLVDVSVTMCMQSMEIAKRNAHPLALAYAHQCLGISFDQSGHQTRAAEHYAQMKLQAHRAKSKLLEAYATIGMGRMLGDAGEKRKEESLLRDAIRIFREVGTPSGEAHAVFSLAEAMVQWGRYAEAITLYDQVLKIYEQYPSTIGRWFAYAALSKAHEAAGDMPLASRYAERAYKQAVEIGLGTYRSQSARRLGEIAKATGDDRLAYAYAVEAENMRSQSERELSSERMLQLAERYEAESRQRHIEELTRLNEKQAADLQRNQLHQRWLWTVLGGSMLMLTGTAVFLFRLRRSHRLVQAANTSLQQSQEEIRALNVGLEMRVQTRTSALRQQTRYLRTLIDMLPMMTWLKDTDSRFLTVNRAVAEIAGQPVEEIVGKTDLDFFPRDLAEAYRADDRETMATRQEKIVEEQVAGMNGRIWIETYKAPVMDEDGSLLGTVGVARDITESKAVAEAREAALAEAERLANMRSQFLAQMSHELRTPLNGILGYAQIMKRNQALDERQIEGLNVIQQSGEHLLMLINDILEFAKIDAGRMELSPGDMALDRFLRTIVSIIRVRAEQKRLKFIVDIAPDLPDWIRADEKRLRQVLLNLLANAVKFTDKGQVRLRVSMPVPDHLHFEVGDSGVGIATEYIERIFQPFEQVGDAHRRAAGTGLGLSISRQLVRLMGGDIEVESELGRGSIFRFEIEAPVAEAWQAGLRIEGRVTGYVGPRRQVLVADDVAENRAVLIDMLAPLGFDTLQAVNGRDAVEMAKLHVPDLILMDLAMPEMDGLEATRALRQLPGFAEIPIIAISASASGKDEESSLTAGMNVFLPKPVELDRLLANIAHVLKLDWTYELHESAEPPGEREIIAPPQHEMDVLHRLALQGNMRDIVLMAERLAGMGERYLPFAERLRTLAKGYQSKAILNFVESYLDQEAGP